VSGGVGEGSEKLFSIRHALRIAAAGRAASRRSPLSSFGRGRGRGRGCGRGGRSRPV
jgi:hypothetical protein